MDTGSNGHEVEVWLPICFLHVPEIKWPQPEWKSTQAYISKQHMHNLYTYLAVRGEDQVPFTSPRDAEHHSSPGGPLWWTVLTFCRARNSPNMFSYVMHI